MNKEISIGFFDIESTGTDVSKDRIVQISIVKTGLYFVPIERKKLLLNPTIPIPKEASDIHGITDDMVKSCFTFAQYAAKLFTYFNSLDFIAGYNIKTFDIPLLYEEFSRCGLVWNPKPAIDSCVIFKKREERTLSAAVKFYCNKEMDGAHDAENDVLATIDVLKGQIDMYELNRYIRLLGESDKINQYPVPVEEILISESKYKDEDGRLSWDGKIVLNDEGKAIFNFGKWKGKELREADLGYVNWLLSSDVSSQTKNIIRSLLNQI